MSCEFIVMNEYLSKTEDDRQDNLLRLLAAYIERQESKAS